MPIGTITNVAAVLVGGVLGCLLGSRLPERWKTTLNGFLGLAALTMGIVLILRVKNLSPVILALIVGGIVGEALRLEQRVNGLVVKVTHKLMGGLQADEG